MSAASNSQVKIHELFPELREKLPTAGLAILPTPVEKLDNLGKQLNLHQLYIKRDDLSGDIYGGNKIRKLDFILPQALKQNAKRVITFGCDGSNHALATAVCAKKLGLRSINLLFPQPNTSYVRKNLLLSVWAGAEIRHKKTYRHLRRSTYWETVRAFIRTGKMPFIIPAGGSTALGAIGFLNAAYELKSQIDSGLMPEPDVIFLPMGTCGTCAGLAAGLGACGLYRTQVATVRVVAEEYVPESVLHKHIREARELWEQISSSAINKLPEIRILNDYLGQAYAVYTAESINAVKLMRNTQGIELEGTYSGKTLAAIIAEKEKLKNKTVLFWNTYNSRDFSALISTLNANCLPKAVRSYFSEPCQQA